MERYPDGAGGKSFFQKRVPKSAPDWLETDGRQHAERHDVARARGRRRRPRGLGGQPRLPRLPRVAVPGGRPRPRRRAAHRPRPAPGRRRSTMVREAAVEVARAARRARHRRRSPKTTGPTAASTSTCGSRRGGTPTRCAPPRSPSPASSSAAGPSSSPARGGRRSAAPRVFVDFNQNAPHKTVLRRVGRPRPRRRAGVDAVRLGRARRRSMPDELTIATVPARVAARRRPVGGDRSPRRRRSSRCSSCTARDLEPG